MSPTVSFQHIQQDDQQDDQSQGDVLPMGSDSQQVHCGLDNGDGEYADQRAEDFSFAAGGKLAVPEDFPADIPLHPRGKLRLSRKLVKKIMGGEAMVILGVPVSFEEAVDFSRRKMKEEGWVLAREAMLDDQQFLSFLKEKRTVAVSVSPEEKETTISITYVIRD